MFQAEGMAHEKEDTNRLDWFKELREAWHSEKGDVTSGQEGEAGKQRWHPI